MSRPTKLSSPIIQKVGNGWQFYWPVEGIEAAVDRIREARGGIVAEVTFRSNLKGKEGLLHMARMDLLSSTARARIVKDLGQRLEGLDWQAMLEQLCFLTVENYRQGEPPINLSREPLPKDPRWIYWPYIEHGGPTMLCAQGGAGKSLLALYIALGIALGIPQKQIQQPESRKVLYLDWETEMDTHIERLHALCVGMDIEREATPPIFYRHMSASLPQAAEAVQAEIAKLEVGFVVLDSAGLAGGGDPKEPGTALSLYNALRKLSTPSLIVHHKPKPTGFKNVGDTFYGSVYWYNGARSVWNLDALKDEERDELTIGMNHTKSNNGRLQQRHAYHLTFQNDTRGRTKRINIKKIPYSEVPGLARKMPLRQRILLELQSGKMTSQELAETLAESQRTVQARLSELKKQDEVLNFPDRSWGLHNQEVV